MIAEDLFSIANSVALLGWIGLLAAPLAPRTLDLVAGWLIPAGLALVYAVLMLVHFAEAPGGYQSLPDVQALFTDADVALAGWVHFLAFDLFIGAWILRDGRAQGFAHWMLVPFLPVVFLFGPAGWLAYLTLRLIGGGPAQSRVVAP